MSMSLLYWELDIGLQVWPLLLKHLFSSVINRNINNDMLQKLLINQTIMHKQMLWTNSVYCIILNGNHMLQTCS